MVEPFSYKNMTTTSKLTLYAGSLSVHISSIMALRSDSSFLFTLGPINLDGHSNIMICTKSAVLHYLLIDWHLYLNRVVQSVVKTTGNKTA